MCEALFRRELDVAENSVDIILEKSQVKQCQKWLHDRRKKELKMFQKVVTALKSFSKTKNDHVPSHQGRD